MKEKLKFYQALANVLEGLIIMQEQMKALGWGPMRVELYNEIEELRKADPDA